MRKESVIFCEQDSLPAGLRAVHQKTFARLKKKGKRKRPNLDKSKSLSKGATLTTIIPASLIPTSIFHSLTDRGKTR